MNDPTNLPFDRILLSPPPAAPDLKSPFGPRPHVGLLDEVPVGPSILPPTRPAAASAPKPEPVKPAVAPPPEPTPAPKPRWVKDALRDFLKMNPKKRVALAVAGTVITAAIGINALLSNKNLEPAAPAPAMAPAPATATAKTEPNLTTSPTSSPGLALNDRIPQVTIDPPAPAIPVIPVLPPVGEGNNPPPPRLLTLSGNNSSTPIPPPTLPASNTPSTLVVPPVIIPASASEPAGPASAPTIPAPLIPPVVLPSTELKKDETKKPGEGTVNTPMLPLVTPSVGQPDKKNEATVIVPPVLSGPATGSGTGGTVTSPTPMTDRKLPGTDTTRLPGVSLPAPDTTRFAPAQPDSSTTAPGPLKLESPTSPSAGTLTLDKQPGVAGVSPVRRSDVRTDFDIDLHEPKAGETYASISQLHYGDARYAEALKTFNRQLELGRGGVVEVPPLYVLRRLGAAGGVVSRTGEPTNPVRGVDWSPVAGRTTEPATFEVARDGMTMWDVAETVLGDRREWKKVADANPGLDPNGLTKGTRIRLPSRR